MPQCRGIPGQGGGREWVGSWGSTLIEARGDGTGEFWKGNQERDTYPSTPILVP